MQPGGGGLPAGFLDRLADAIVSVEYYMETLQSGRSDPWYMLDNARDLPADARGGAGSRRCRRWRRSIRRQFDKTLQHSRLRVAARGARRRRCGTDAGVQPLRRCGRSSAARCPRLPIRSCVALFIEEAREELAKIARQFPAWDQNPLEQDVLVTAAPLVPHAQGQRPHGRRARAAEFAWASENLLNRLLDNTLTRSPPIVADAARSRGRPAGADRAARERHGADRRISRRSSRERTRSLPARPPGCRSRPPARSIARKRWRRSAARALSAAPPRRIRRRRDRGVVPATTYRCIGTASARTARSVAAPTG